MTNERTNRYAEALVAIATAEHALDAVESELLTVARAIESNEALRRQLTDANLPVGRRLAFVETEVLAAAHPATRSCLATVIAADRVGELTAVAEEVARRAAAARDEELAEVYVAVPIDDARKQALKEALERATGRRLELKVYVDESVVGGVRATIGDTVIDGSLANRLGSLRTRAGA
ncbi:MAG: ATP synthase F1 subunit delta [Nitriliruptor sp.]|nr:MAG: ATP synthase F1 subunit delta [Nitriliruptor sp.]